MSRASLMVLTTPWHLQESKLLVLLLLR